MIEKAISPNLLSKAFDGTYPIIFFTTDQEGLITSLSDSWKKYTGFSKNDTISKSIFDFISFSKENPPITIQHITTNTTEEKPLNEYATLATKSSEQLKTEIHLYYNNDGVEGLIYILPQKKEEKLEEESYSQLLETLSAGVSSKTGQELFKSFVLSLQKLLSADFIFIGEYSVEKHNVSTLALCHKQEIIENFAYDLQNTLCQDVMKANVCIVKDGVQDLYPKDEILIEMDIEGYIGVPLFNQQGLPIGIIVALYSSSIENSQYFSDILQVFSGRASAELERMQMDRQLKEKEDILLNERTFLRRLIDSIPDLIFIKDLEGKFVLCNAAFEALTGKKEHELKKITDFSLFSKEVAQQFRDRDKEVIKSLKMVRNEEWGYTLEGKKVRLDTLKAPYKDREGNVQGIIGISRNITDLIETRITLQKSEQLYKSAVTVLNEGIVVHDAHGEIISCNESSEKILGLTFDQMRGRTSLDPRWKAIKEDHTLFPGEEHPASVVLKTHKPVRDIIMGVYNPEGKIAWITINSEPVFDSTTKKLSSVVSSFTDITRFKQLQEALKESEFQYRSLFEMATDSILLTSGYEIVANNPKVTEIFKLQQFSLIGVSIQDISISDNSPQSVKILDDFINNSAHGDELKLEWDFKGEEGNTIHTELTISHIEINGKDRFMLFIHDISERKKNEKAIKAQNKELKKTNQELDNFVYRVSHDLRSPISSVLGLIEVMRQEKDELELNKYFDFQEETMKRLDSFIADILDYSKNTRVSFQSEEIDIKKTIETIFSQNQFSEKTEDLEVSIKIDQKTPFLNDRLRIQIILNNLISNAIRYQNFYLEKRFIQIKGKSTAKGLKLKIKDNGIGIKADHLERIFEMFYRATSNKPGSGLGLYIVKSAVEKLKGEISVKSEYGEGTTFSVFIPNKKK